jgi:hypothetical protein
VSVDAGIRATGPSYPSEQARPTGAERRSEAPGAVDEGPDPVRWLLRAAPLALVAVILAVVLRLSALHLGNDDTWFHLVLGHRFRTGWSLTAPGGLTPFATSGWVPTQWSTEVLASLLEDRWGLPGVAWLFGALYLALVAGTYLSCRTRGRPLAAVVPTGLLVLGAAPVLSARPQVVSLVLLTVTVAAWLRTADDGRPRWWLVPMTWVWATAHGLWSAGVLLGLVCWVGLVLDRRVTGRRSLAVLAVPVLSLVATTLTPVGPRLLTSQLAVSARTGLIAEWGPTSFRSVPALAVALMLGLLTVVWVRRGGLSWSRVLLLALAAGWTLLVSRMVPLGGVVAAPLLAEALERALADADVADGSPGAGRRERFALAALATAYLVVLALAAPRLAAAPADEPTALAPRLAALPAGSTVLVEDGIGGWLEWRVPHVHPVIDGMLDAYPVGYIADFFATTRVEPGWRSFVAASGARSAVLDRGSPLSTAMRERLGWRVLQRDRSWVYLAAPGG